MTRHDVASPACIGPVLEQTSSFVITLRCQPTNGAGPDSRPKYSVTTTSIVGGCLRVRFARSKAACQLSVNRTASTSIRKRPKSQEPAELAPRPELKK
jgi:hypothetical protein